MANKPKYSRKKIREALEASAGIKKRACDILGCSRQTLDNYLAADPELEETLRQAGEQLLDVGEDWLAQWVTEGDPKAVFFLLETRGKTRGYSKRTEITGDDGSAPITFNLVQTTGK